MDIQFEVDGEFVDAADLESVLGSRSVTGAVRRMAERIRQEAAETCELHHEQPTVTVVISGVHGIGVRVSGCCESFVNRVQDRVKTVFMHSARFSGNSVPGMNLIVSVQGANKSFAFEVARIDRLVIGRVDPDTGERPDIDLSAFGAYANGVSRRHASIVQWNRSLHLVDGGSHNGTFLNDERLKPGEPRVLKYGDRVRIGRLVLEVTVDYPAGVI